MEILKICDLYENLENWMTNLPPKLKCLPINLLAIPGTHDSMTSAINRSSQLSPDAEECLRRIQFLGPILRLFMARWARTQTLDMKQQLYNGIRYFDLRVATKKNVNYAYMVHGQYSFDVLTVFKELRDFLTSHPMEVVILDFQHFYAFETADHQNLIQLIKSEFGSLLLPYTSDMQHVTLEFMTVKCKYQVIVIYRDYSAKSKEALLWPNTSFPSPWPNTVDKSELFATLTEGIASRSFSIGYISQCILTPTTWFVVKHLYGSLKKQIAKKILTDAVAWIRNQKIGIGGVNIIICDFVHLKNNLVIKEVIALNAKFLNNSLLCASNINLTPVDTA